MIRADFIKTASRTGRGLATTPLMFHAKHDDDQLNKQLVQEVVGDSHWDSDKVKSMHAEFPTLINAVHDWMHGVFETGLGAASHVGV